MCDIFDRLHMFDIFIFGDHRLCTKSVPPPPPNCFLIVLRQLSECSHEEAVYGARGRVLPHNTYTGICAAQPGRDLGTPDLERGIHFRDVS